MEIFVRTKKNQKSLPTDTFPLKIYQKCFCEPARLAYSAPPDSVADLELFRCWEEEGEDTEREGQKKERKGSGKIIERKRCFHKISLKLGPGYVDLCAC